MIESSGELQMLVNSQPNFLQRNDIGIRLAKNINNEWQAFLPATGQ